MQQLRPNAQPQQYSTTQGPENPEIPRNAVENSFIPAVQIQSPQQSSADKNVETRAYDSVDESELLSDEEPSSERIQMYNNHQHNQPRPSFFKTKSEQDNIFTPQTPKALQLNSRSFSVQLQQMNQNRSRVGMDIDFCQLYAYPLLQYDQNKNPLPFAQPLDCSDEFEKFIDVFKESGREFSMKRQIGTLETLVGCLLGQYNPTILHISCHGKKITNKMREIQKIALALEPSSGDAQNPIGFCHYVEETLLIQRFQSFRNLKTKCVFISACHSERIGKILKLLGIPIVIAINSTSEVEDQAAKEFAENFYRFGMSMSVEQAFQQSVNALKTANRDLSYCCCHHSHESYCSWVMNLVKSKDQKAAHDIHDPSGKCNCGIPITEQERLNTHFSDCKFVKKFNDTIKKLEDQNICTFRQAKKEDKKNRFNCDIPNKIEDPEEQKEIKNHSKSKSSHRPKEVVCCCKEEEPHDEFNKFKFISIRDARPETMSDKQYQEILSKEQEFYKQPLFTQEELEKIPYGDIFIKDCNPQQKQIWDHLEQIENQANLVCRNVQIQKIADLIYRSKFSSKKLIHVYGQSNNGKRDLANWACRYALNGRVKDFQAAFSIQIETIEEKGKKHPYSQHSLIKAIMHKFREYEDIQDEYQFKTLMKQGKFIFVIDQCQRFIQQDRLGFQNSLIDFIKSYHESLVILITRDQDDFNSSRDKWESLEIHKPNQDEAFQIMLSVIQERQHDNHALMRYKNEIQQYPERDYQHHRFFQFKNRTTQEIIKFARQIDLTKPLHDNLNYLSLQRDKNKDQIEGFGERSMFLLPKLKEMSDPIYKINHLHLFVLGLMQSRKGGLLRVDLEELFQILQENHFQNGFQMTWREFMIKLDYSPASQGDAQHQLLQHTNSDTSIQSKSEFFRIERIMDSRDDRYIPSEDLCSLIQNGEFEELYRKSFSASECYKSQMQELGAVYIEVINYMNLSIRKIVDKNIHNFIMRDNLKYVGISLDKEFLRSFKNIVDNIHRETDSGMDMINEESKSEIYKLDHIYLANVVSLLNLKLLSRFFKSKEGFPIKQDMHKSHSHPHIEEEKKQKKHHRQNKEEFQEPPTNLIEELCINALTQLIGNQDYMQAREIIKEGIKIGNKFKIYSLRGKLLFIQAGLDIEEKRIYDQVIYRDYNQEHTRNRVNLKKYQDIKDDLQDALTCLGSDYHSKDSRNQQVKYLEYLLELQFNKCDENRENYMTYYQQQISKDIASRIPNSDQSQELIRYKHLMLHIKQQLKTCNSSKKYTYLLNILCDLQKSKYYSLNLREQLRHATLAALIKYHIAQIPDQQDQEEEKIQVILTRASKRNDHHINGGNEMKLKMLQESLNHLEQAFSILRSLKQCLTLSQYVKRKQFFKRLEKENLSLINEFEIDYQTDAIYLLSSNPISHDASNSDSALLEPTIQIQDKLEYYTKAQKKILKASEDHGFSSLVLVRQIKEDSLNILAKCNTSKILFLEQEHFIRKDSLVVVSDQGSAQEYSMEFLSIDYDHLEVEQLPFELLILAFAGSQEIAENVFKERMNSGYIICFAQPNLIDGTETQAFVLIQRIINLFCTKLVKSLMKKQHSTYQNDCTFEDVFQDMVKSYYQPKFDAKMYYIIKHKQETSSNDQKIGYDMSPLDRPAKEDKELQNYRPILMTGKFAAPQFFLNKPPQADQKTLCKKPKENSFTINYIDNIDRPLSLEPMLGRNYQVHQLLGMLNQNIQIIQICGEQGVGKKFFIKRALKYYYDLQAIDQPVKIGFMPTVSQVEFNFLKDTKDFCYQLKRAQLRDNFKMIVVIEDFWERLIASQLNEDIINEFFKVFLRKIENLTLILLSTEGNNLFNQMHQFFVNLGNCIELYKLDL